LVAGGAVDGQGLLERGRRARVIVGEPPRDAQLVEGVGLAVLVAELLCLGHGYGV
jgi:hypothetical protein